MLINLTPHPIVLRSGENEIVVPPSGSVARVTSRPGALLDTVHAPGRVGDVRPPVPVYGPPAWGDVEGLPPQGAEAAVYIVSALVAARCGDRADVVAPGTGPADEAVRDAKGRIVAVTRLIAASEWFGRVGG